ncbi:hypothetical protein KC19_VG182000 [Ceratodon purpureus]|uniref:Secreted protein n=1 Tax=Ceratodon purpureus TaxID=3225 RepID=A0A8T0HSF4_CERPU|nr:hypothetical protein KC19_VG182000 [Ceratodon purpureus]
MDAIARQALLLLLLRLACLSKEWNKAMKTRVEYSALRGSLQHNVLKAGEGISFLLILFSIHLLRFSVRCLMFFIVFSNLVSLGCLQSGGTCWNRQHRL